MSKLRISLLTIESDSADPTLMGALRELLDRAGVRSVVMTSPEPATPTAPSSRSTAIAESLMHGSLQEQAMDEVTRHPGLKVEQLAGLILNDYGTDALRRVQHAVDPLVIAGRLERTGSGKLYTPACAATLPAFQRPEPKPAKTKPLKATSPAQAVEREPCTQHPPCKGCRSGGACVSIVKPTSLVPPAIAREASASARLDGETRVVDGEFPEVDEAPPAKPLRVQVPQGEKMPAGDPGGRVEGFPAPPPAPPGSDTERIVALVHERPGITVHELTREICGGVCNGGTIRRIDMLVGPLTMSGKVVRFNGRLFSDMKTAAALKLPPPNHRTSNGARQLSHGPAPLANVQKSKDQFDQVVALFAEDHATPIPDVARELFGSSTGRTTEKVQLMLKQLCATKRLRALGGGSYRPISDDERAREDEVDDVGDEEDDAGDGDDQELESNGAPDEDSLEELDLA